jgi:hypothetical protein
MLKYATLNDSFIYKHMKTEIDSSDDENVDVGIIKTQPKRGMIKFKKARDFNIQTSGDSKRLCCNEFSCIVI